MGLMRNDTKVADMTKEQLEEMKVGLESAGSMIDRMRQFVGDEVADKMEKGAADLKKALDTGDNEAAQKALDALKASFPQRGSRRGGRGGDAGGRGGEAGGRGGEAGGRRGRGGAEDRTSREGPTTPRRAPSPCGSCEPCGTRAGRNGETVQTAGGAWRRRGGCHRGPGG